MPDISRLTPWPVFEFDLPCLVKDHNCRNEDAQGGNRAGPHGFVSLTRARVRFLVVKAVLERPARANTLLTKL